MFYFVTNHRVGMLCELQAKCPLNHPPGNEIYRKANLSFFEIDGRKNKVCRTWENVPPRCYIIYVFGN